MRRLAFVLLLSLAARLAAEEAIGRPADDPGPGEPAIERGMILLDVAFDGAAARVMLDSGAPRTVWIGQRGREGDERGETHDVHGERLLYWLGTVSLGIGSEDRTVPVQRMERFPHLEEVAEALGVKVGGLVGLSALGRRRVVLDPAAKTLPLETEKAPK